MTTDPAEIIAKTTDDHALFRLPGLRYVCEGCDWRRPWDDDEAHEDHAAHVANAVLAALAAAGWTLLPPGGQSGEVWRCVYLDNGGAFITHSREALERHCAVTRCHDPGPLDPPPRPWQHQTAQRTVWPDGREHTTPWEPA